MTGNLVKRLREEDPECGLRHSIAMEASDCIEAMQKALEEIAAVPVWDEYRCIEIARNALLQKEKKYD
jgi:hypothetical protein